MAVPGVDVRGVQGEGRGREAPAGGRGGDVRRVGGGGSREGGVAGAHGGGRVRGVRVRRRGGGVGQVAAEEVRRRLGDVGVGCGRRGGAAVEGAAGVVLLAVAAGVQRLRLSPWSRSTRPCLHDHGG